MTGEELKRNLVDFARKWSLYDGTERAEAQTFLNELFAAYGQDRREVGARFEEQQAGRFLDLIWPRVCLIEMKRPSEAGRLATHREQAFAYWRNAADPEHNVPAPQYVVLCAFRRFEVWEPGAYPNLPRSEFDLIELPERLDSLAFIAQREPMFIGTQAAVTQDAVRLVTSLFAALGDRRAAPPDELRDFVLQSVWCMFAEDLGQLEAHLFTQILDDLIANPRRSSADELGGLFGWLNRDAPRPAGGLYANTRYVNGGLFEQPARVHLDQDELRVLRLACEYDWRKVEPHIFGSLLEGALGRDAQWELGAHYTHEVDIQKVVTPSIVAPWRERIGNANTLAEVQHLQNELLNYVVLDPACGSGNFLYIAYRELRRLEKQLHDKERELRQAGGLRARADQAALAAFFPLSNIKGIEINAFAVSLARVTLWMAHKLAVDELDLTEATLPLENLDGIRAADALRVPWPQASVIIGNPPFHGDRHLRRVLGDQYVEWLRREFRVGVKDYCVYWFRKTHDELGSGARAGLVGTNSVAQNRARTASLDYILEHGGVIVDAVSSQDWPGLAAVDVSIVNWIKEPRTTIEHPTLDGHELGEPIASSLRPASLAVDSALPLDANANIAFFGPVPGVSGFVIGTDEAETLLRQGEHWRQVVRPYLIGDDILSRPDQSPSRYVIDFGFMSLEEAARFPAALDIVRERVKPTRDRPGPQAAYRRTWWRFTRPLRDMREALEGMSRFIVGPAQGKRIPFCFAAAEVCPSNLLTVFALDEDYHLGVLSATPHRAWIDGQRSTLEDRTRYSVTYIFATYPWPSPSDRARQDVAACASALREVRRALCHEYQIGMTRLYNLVDEGGFASVLEAQRELDQAVGRAYGWAAGDATDPVSCKARLLELNRAIAASEVPYGGPRS